MSVSPREFSGWCPICERPVRYVATDAWYRDSLVCVSCGSIPRERALAAVLSMAFPNWRKLSIHEASPILGRGISKKISESARRYMASQFDPQLPRGGGARFRNEDLEHQTFGAETFDLVITLDVMEHVNMPDQAAREIWRTLRKGGAYLFTAPTWAHRLTSERQAEYLPNGQIRFIGEPEYHGGATGKRSLVTFAYGLDLPVLLSTWAPFDVTAFRFAHQSYGILGEMTDVYLCRKR